MKLTAANKLSIFYKFACAPSEDSDQPAHPRSLIRIFARALWVAKDPKRLQADGKCSGMHTQMRRLVWVFAWRTYNIVGNAVSYLKGQMPIENTQVSSASMHYYKDLYTAMSVNSKLFRVPPGPSCSKLTMSLVNVSSKLWLLNMAYILMLLLKKMWVAFAFAKYAHIFFSKNTCDTVLSRRNNILTTNELVKL